MARRLLTALSALSLAPCLATAGCWARSGFISDHFQWESNCRAYVLNCGRGELWFMGKRIVDRSQSDTPLAFRHWSTRPAVEPACDRLTFLHRLGFSDYNGLWYGQWAGPFRQRIVTAPCWSLAAASAALPVALFGPTLRRSR